MPAGKFLSSKLCGEGSDMKGKKLFKVKIMPRIVVTLVKASVCLIRCLSQS